MRSFFILLFEVIVAFSASFIYAQPFYPPDSLIVVQILKENGINEKDISKFANTPYAHCLYYDDRIRSLYFKHAGLKNLPENISQLSELEELSLTGNALQSIPASIGQLKNLYRLFLDSNYIQSLPDSIAGLRELRWLILSHNSLEIFPEPIIGLTSLWKLNLSQNRLRSLPESIGKLQNLQELILDDNNLSTLPSSIGSLGFLRELHLRNNSFSELPENIFLLDTICYEVFPYSYFGKLCPPVAIHLDGNMLCDLSKEHIAWLYKHDKTWLEKRGCAEDFVHFVNDYYNVKRICLSLDLVCKRSYKSGVSIPVKVIVSNIGNTDVEYIDDCTFIKDPDIKVHAICKDSSYLLNWYQTFKRSGPDDFIPIPVIMPGFSNRMQITLKALKTGSYKVYATLLYHELVDSPSEIQTCNQLTAISDTVEIIVNSNSKSEGNNRDRE